MNNAQVVEALWLTVAELELVELGILVSIALLVGLMIAECLNAVSYLVDQNHSHPKP